MSTLDHMLEPEAQVVRRVEVITGTGRRRRFSDDVKARDHRRDACSGCGGFRDCAAAWVDASAVVWVAAASAAISIVRHRQECGTRVRAGRRGCAGPGTDVSKPRNQAGPPRLMAIIEVTIDGVTVRVGRGAEAKTIAAVIRALKAGP